MIPKRQSRDFPQERRNAFACLILSPLVFLISGFQELISQSKKDDDMVRNSIEQGKAYLNRGLGFLLNDNEMYDWGVVAQSNTYHEFTRLCKERGWTYS